MTRHAKPSRRIKVKAEKDDNHARQRGKSVEHVEQGFLSLESDVKVIV